MPRRSTSSCRCRCRSRRRPRLRGRCSLRSRSEASAGIPRPLVRALDPDRRVAVLADDSDMPYDLFLGVPTHVVPPVVEASGLTVDGWIPVEPAHARDLRSRRLRGRRRDERRDTEGRSVRRGSGSGRRRPDRGAHPGRRRVREYDGRGICYLEFGHDQVAKVDVTFVSGQAPRGGLEGPSRVLVADKVEFGTSRVRRWFGREWVPEDRSRVMGDFPTPDRGLEELT